jgi:hypothetical protein
MARMAKTMRPPMLKPVTANEPSSLTAEAAAVHEAAFRFSRGAVFIPCF